jgi:hypothetical protein
MVTLTDPITNMPTPDGTLVLQTIPMVMVGTAAPQPGMELLLIQHQAYKED